MLQRLSIQNYALIDTLDISFSEKLNILTGETGAGKSIILGALSLILGQRVESKYFYNQQKKCVIEGYFKAEQLKLQDFFAENDLDYQEETMLRREINADGKSRAFVNDTPVNLQVLKQLGEMLIDIHSQHATLELNDPSFQLLVVDSIAGHADTLQQYRQTYQAYQAKLAELKDMVESSRQSKADADYFQFQFDELENARIEPDEQELLEQELNSLTHAEDIKRSYVSALHLLEESDQAALSQLKEALQNLQQAGRYDTSAHALTERLHSIWIEARDIASELSSLEQKTTYDPEKAAETGRRLDLLYTLQKKHHVDSNAALIGIKDSLNEKLNLIGNADEEIARLQHEVEKLKQECIELAGLLNKNRSKAIPGIESNLAAALSDMAMPNASLTIHNDPLSGTDFGPKGYDRISFLFSANKGLPPAPVSKVASGGELSRLMLAIKSLVAHHSALPAIIFDEIDTGISGEVAQKVGIVLEQLAENMQVIAITHLPQIASKGKAHYLVYKDEGDNSTHTNIRLLSDAERVTELAKMLSGDKPGESALQNARELLG